ncbi:hypothetical protein Tco_0128192 [Tanacetum coccineum]
MTHKLDDMIELPNSLLKKTNKEDLEYEMVRVKIRSCMSWLGSTNACDVPIGSLRMMDNKVGNTRPQSTPQILPLFEEYTLPVTYPKEVKDTIGIPMEVEPFDLTQLEVVGLDTYVILGDERGPKPPIKPHSPNSFRMKEVDDLIIHIPPSPHMAFFHPKDVYCYYHPCIDDAKKHFGFKPGVLGQSGSIGVNFSNLEMIKDDWKSKSKEVSFLGRRLNLPDKPKEVEKVRIKDLHHLEHVFQLLLFPHMALLHHNGVYRYYHPHLTLSVGKPSL